MTALPGAGGLTAAWKMQIATVDGMGAAVARLVEGAKAGRVMRNAITGIPPYAIPDVAIEAVRPDLPFTAGYMRGSPQREICFFTESFIDELAGNKTVDSGIHPDAKKTGDEMAKGAGAVAGKVEKAADRSKTSK